MASSQNYKTLLARAKSKLPKSISQHERFNIPEPDVLIEGKTTVLRNFGEIADAIRRNPTQVLAYLLREIGTAGSLDGNRVIFKGKVTTHQIEDRIKEYVDTYVLCSECNRPDTRLVKDDRVLILECDACGAHRPVHVRKVAKAPEAEAIEEGKVYELMIQDVGKKGDGVAKKDRFIIYVPGTTKGSIVKIRIDKVVGTVCFGSVVRE